MKRSDKIALLERILAGKITKEQLTQHLSPDPSSIHAILITENAKFLEPDEPVTATLSFEGSRESKSRTMPFKQLEALINRLGGTLIILPHNHRNRV